MVDKIAKHLTKKGVYLVEEEDDHIKLMCMQHYNSKACSMTNVIQNNKLASK